MWRLNYKEAEAIIDVHCICRIKLRLRTDRTEKMFKNSLTHGIADVLLARIFVVPPLLVAAEVKQLGYIVKDQFSNCLPVTLSARYKLTSECTIRAKNSIELVRAYQEMRLSSLIFSRAIYSP